MLALVLAVLASLQEAKALELVQTIPLPKVEGRIDHLAIVPRPAASLSPPSGNNTVEIIELAQGKVIHRIDGLQEPQGVLSVEGRLVVAFGGDGSCRLYDGESFKLVRTVDCKSDADIVRYDEDAKRVYVGYTRGALGHPESLQLEARRKQIFINVRIPDTSSSPTGKSAPSSRP